MKLRLTKFVVFVLLGAVVNDGVGTVSMTRKAKAFWIGFLTPVITLWV